MKKKACLWTESFRGTQRQRRLELCLLLETHKRPGGLYENWQEVVIKMPRVPRVTTFFYVKKLVSFSLLQEVTLCCNEDKLREALSEEKSWLYATCR